MKIEKLMKHPYHGFINKSFLQNAGKYIEKNYVYNSGIVINAHPLSNYVEITEQY